MSSSERQVRTIISWLPSGKKKAFAVQIHDGAFYSFCKSMYLGHGYKHFDCTRCNCNTFDEDFNTVLHIIKSTVRHDTPGIVRTKYDHPGTLTATFELNKIIGTVNFRRKSWSTHNVDIVFTREADGTYITSYAMPSSYDI